MDFLPPLLCLLRLGVLLLGLAAVQPAYEVGCFLLLLATLAVDRIVVPANPRMDENLLLLTVLGGRVLNLCRSAGEPSQSLGPTLLFSSMLSMLSLAILWHARDPPARLDWIVHVVLAALFLATASTHASYEPVAPFVCRALAYFVLAHLLYLDAHPEACRVRPQGFLPCFCPLLVIHWAPALVFTGCALLELHYAPGPQCPTDSPPAEVI